MRRQWPLKRLGELCAFQRGLTYSKTDEVEASNNVVLRATNIDLATNLLDLTELKFIRDDFIVPESKIVRKDSLLICTASGSKSHLGKVAFVDDDYGYAFGGFMGMLAPASEIHPRFLFHLMTSGAYKQFIDELSDGANINNLRFDDLSQFEVPCPEPGEQRRIVKILDEAFASIAAAKAHAEQNRQNAHAILELGFREICGEQPQKKWRLSTVREIARAEKGTIRTGPFGSQLLHSEFVEEGIAVLGIDNAVANEFRWGKNRFITQEKFRQLSRYLVRPGDVLITIMGTCGRCAVVPEDVPTAINTKHLCCITLDREKCLPHYLHRYFLHHPIARDHLQTQAKGAIMEGLNMGIIQEMPVVLPPVAEQKQIVATLDALSAETRRLESLYTQKLAALDELKASLLHQAFSGQL